MPLAKSKYVLKWKSVKGLLFFINVVMQAKLTINFQDARVMVQIGPQYGINSIK